MKNNLLIKNNLLLIVMLVIMNIVLIGSISYYFGLMNFFSKKIINDNNFSKIIVSLKGNYEYADIKNEILKNEHVIEVWNNLEYDGYGKITSLEFNDLDGGIIIEAISETKKDLLKENYPKEKYDIICPNNFYPDYKFVKKYDYYKQINLKKYINKKLKIEYNDVKESEFKLVGLYDNSKDFMSPNVCYTTKETLYDLNKSLGYELDDSSMIILLDDINNMDAIYSINNIASIDRMASINQSIIDNSKKILTITLILMFSFTISFIYLIYSRSIVSNSKNIGILLLAGFTRKKIKGLYYFNSLKLSLMPFSIAIFINLIFEKYLFTLLLHKKVGLALMEVKMTFFSIIIIFIVNIICLFISSFITLKKIDDLEVSDMLYE